MRPDIAGLIRPQVRDLRAYHVEEPDVPVKLHANESPYNLSERVRKEISKEVFDIHFNRYPDPDCFELRDLLALRLGVERRHILLGNGSDELIQMIIMAFGGQGAHVVFPHPTFSMYRIIALSMGEKTAAVPLLEDFELDLASMVERVREASSITFISYPNNPTGNCFAAEAIEEVISASRGIVIVDEAYFDYSGKTFLDRLGDHSNLVILRTLSKIGLASLRLGILIAPEEIVDAVNRVRLPYNIGSLARTAAVAALKAGEEMEEHTGRVVTERDRVFAALERLDFVTPFRTDANFILFRVDDSDRVFNGLVEKGVLVRNIGDNGPLKNCLRVTIGRPEENDAFLEAMTGL